MAMNCNGPSRTSSKQFDIMINFMEQSGDLISKVSSGQRNRLQDKLQAIQDWEELTRLLNDEPTGRRNPTEKWRKVWSDIKNNTRRKAVKIKTALSESGSASLDVRCRLTPFEQRVLKFIPEFDKHQFSGTRVISPQTYPGKLLMSPSEKSLDQSSVSPPVFVGVPAFSPRVDASPPSMSPHSMSDKESEPPSPVAQHTNSTPPLNSVTTSKQKHSVIPAISGRAPKNEGIPTKYTSARSKERARNGRINEKLLTYIIEKGQADLEMEKERLRLREMELDIQRHWQNVAAKAIDALHKVVESKFNTE